MYSQGSTFPTRSATVLALSFCSVLFSACGPGDVVEIDQIRPAPPGARFVRADASSSERFGGGQVSEHDHDDPGASRFVWQMPDGWVELAPKQFRDVNLRPGGHPELECYLTILQGDGGGLAANVNRWRGQLGLDSITDAAAAQLPATTLFGRPAILVELKSEGADARALLGVIFTTATTMATVKLTGPVALVEGQRAGFELFRATLNVREEVSDAPSRPAAGSTGSGAPGGSGRPGGLSFELPEGWTDVGAGSMRIVNLQSPGSSQFYVIRLGGEAGGLINNLNRWRGEVGLEAFDQAGIDALEKVQFMGQECGLLEVSGAYQGMSDQVGNDMTLLGVVLIGSDSSLFVKMVGPEADVAAERQRFLDLLASLKDA